MSRGCGPTSKSSSRRGRSGSDRAVSDAPRAVTERISPSPPFTDDAAPACSQAGNDHEHDDQPDRHPHHERCGDRHQAGCDDRERRTGVPPADGGCRGLVRPARSPSITMTESRHAHAPGMIAISMAGSKSAMPNSGASPKAPTMIPAKIASMPSTPARSKSPDRPRILENARAVAKIPDPTRAVRGVSRSDVAGHNAVKPKEGLSGSGSATASGDWRPSAG